MSSLKREIDRLEEMEQMTSDIRVEIEKLKKGELPQEMTTEITQLQLENTKLKHRLAILENAIEAEKKSQQSNAILDDNNSNLNFENGMISITEHLITIFSKSIQKSFPQLNDNLIKFTIITPVSSNASKFGDYQCNSAMPISKELKSQFGISKSPRDIANEIEANIEKSPLIEKTEVASAGFVNIFLAKSYAINALTDILKNGVKPPYCKKQRIIVDFSSPNIAKEMHVGHLRSTIIGESICRLFEFMGHDVLRVNHVGDWGTQFGMLIAHLEDRFPNYLTESPPISDLQAFYKESKKRFDEDEEFKKRAYKSVVNLQSGEPNSRKAWNLICNVSREEFQKIYNRLDVKITEKGESFYHNCMIDIVNHLEERNLLENDEGRKIMWSNDEKTGIPLTIVKNDGGFTYDTSDMACIRYRFEEEKANWIIYVVDAGQSIHFKTLFDCAKRANIMKNEQRADHIQFGVVLGEDGKKFKTRSGDTVKLSDLLDEGLKRSMDKLIEKGRDKVLTNDELKSAQESIAYGCIKYADLSHNRTNEYVFSFDRMLEDRGNTAVYLFYAYTRICSISRNSGDDFSNLKKILENDKIHLDHDKEWKLAKILLKFPDILIKIHRDLLLHILCEYCYDVCTTFTEFYDNCYCIEKDNNGKIIKVNRSRILLCEATASILRQCFYLLGLKPIMKI